MAHGKQSFEEMLNETDQIVNNLESGKLTLDEQIKAFEEGVNLIHQCEKMLSDAENKVQILTTNNGNIQSSTDGVLETFNPQNNQDSAK